MILYKGLAESIAYMSSLKEERPGPARSARAGKVHNLLKGPPAGRPRSESVPPPAALAWRMHLAY